MIRDIKTAMKIKMIESGQKLNIWKVSDYKLYKFEQFWGGGVLNAPPLKTMKMKLQSQMRNACYTPGDGLVVFATPKNHHFDPLILTSEWQFNQKLQLERFCYTSGNGLVISWPLGLKRLIQKNVHMECVQICDKGKVKKMRQKCQNLGQL